MDANHQTENKVEISLSIINDEADSINAGRRLIKNYTNDPDYANSFRCQLIEKELVRLEKSISKIRNELTLISLSGD